VLQVLAKVSEPVVAVKEVGLSKGAKPPLDPGLRAGALIGEPEKIFCEDNRVNNDGNSGA
jgi:hypothetical protein